MYIRRHFIILLLTFLFSARICSLDLDENYILIVLSTESSTEADQNSFNDIITDIISLEFEMRGLKVLSVPMTSQSKLLQKSKKENASYFIECLYRSDTEHLSIVLDCYRVNDSFLMYNGTINSTIDLELDVNIKESIKTLIEIIEEDIRENPQLITINLPEEKKDENNESFKFRHFTITAGFSPFFTTGQASNYFFIGFVPHIHSQYRIKLQFGYLGLGWFVKSNFFKAEGLSFTSDNILLSTGPDVRLALEFNTTLEVFLSLKGGLSLFLMNRNDEGYQRTLVPYTSGGLGFNINLTSSLGITVSTNYSVHFENSVFITGFSPAMGIYFIL